MAKTKLYVPDRYADKKVEKKVEKEEKPELQVSDAYTEENKRVLDPSLLKKSAKERIPQPTGYRVATRYPVGCGILSFADFLRRLGSSTLLFSSV